MWLKLSQSLLIIVNIFLNIVTSFRSAVQLEHGSLFFKNYFSSNKTDGVQFIHAGYKFCSCNELENSISLKIHSENS